MLSNAKIVSQLDDLSSSVQLLYSSFIVSNEQMTNTPAYVSTSHFLFPRKRLLFVSDEPIGKPALKPTRGISAPKYF